MSFVLEETPESVDLVVMGDWMREATAFLESETATVQSMLQGTVISSGATVVESHPVKISGGTALAAHLTSDSSDMWMLAVIADDRSHALSVLQSGDQRDDAFSILWH